jgi:hypothetical protein
MRTVRLDRCVCVCACVCVCVWVCACVRAWVYYGCLVYECMRGSLERNMLEAYMLVSQD